MATGRQIQLTKQVGEYLACAELCRRGYITTSFTGNVPDFDVLVVNNENKSIPIQVKTLMQGSWQLRTNAYFDIEFTPDGKQIVKNKKSFSQNIIYIFIKLNGQGKDDFYILSIKDLQDFLFEGYTKYLDKHGGRRPKNPISVHLGLDESQLIKFKDNWLLLDKSFN